MNSHAHHFVFPLPLHTTPYLTGVCKYCGAESRPHLAVETTYGVFSTMGDRTFKARQTRAAAKLEKP